MRQTRSETIKVLRQTLGQSEETEHVIDWVQDSWSTYDHLSKLIGKAYACQIMEATDVEDRLIELEEGVSQMAYPLQHNSFNTCINAGLDDKIVERR